MKKAPARGKRLSEPPEPLLVTSSNDIGDGEDGGGNRGEQGGETVHSTLLMGDRVPGPFGPECNTRFNLMSIYFSLASLARLSIRSIYELSR